MWDFSECVIVIVIVIVIALRFRQRDSLPWPCEDDVVDDDDELAPEVRDACASLVFGVAVAFAVALECCAAAWLVTAGRTWGP